MTVFLVCDAEEQTVLVQATLEGNTGKGHIREQVRPDEDFFGHTYDELMRLGSGRHELEPKPPAPPDG